MPRKKPEPQPEESPDERIDRLRRTMEPNEYIKRLNADATAIINEMFFIGEKLQANLDGIKMPETLIPTEHMVIVGFQFIDDEGSRGGDVRLLYRDGSMPSWIAEGLISRAGVRCESQYRPAEFYSEGDGAD